MSDSIDRVFSHALQTVKRIPSVGSSRPPDQARLKLYGLYKQSTEGNVAGIIGQPQNEGPANGSGVSELDKWHAWKSNQGLSRTEAKRRYISTLIETMHTYASSTPAARELIAELEFVWDQIKDVSTSSSDLSPAPNLRDAAMQQPSPSYPHRRNHESSQTDALRILRPLNDNDEAHYMDDSDYNRDGIVSPSPRDQRWKRRMEQTLSKMVVEIAALRESIEMSKVGGHEQRANLRLRVLRFAWGILRHFIVDAFLITTLLLWARRQDTVIKQGISILLLRLKATLPQLRGFRVQRKIE